MTLVIVLSFLALALLAYAITGGADFGVGILEALSPRAERQATRRLAEKAIAPVWEANHIWVILALVITFVAFPSIHVRITTSLTVPLLIMLIGIILRGTAFTFRYYDWEDESGTESVWTWLFRSGSVLVPLAFGHLAAATSRGQLRESPSTVYETYYHPWLGWFPFTTGCFTCVLFAWIAAVFLVDEVSPGDHDRWVRRARRWTVGVVLAGALVTLSAWVEDVPWLGRIGTNPMSILAIVLASAGVGALFLVLPSRRPWRTRALVGTVVGTILLGYWGAHYPVALEFHGGGVLTWPDAAAPEATRKALSIALVGGALVILPGLGVLYRLFKGANPPPE